MSIRKLEKQDYNKGYLNLLENLTVVGKISKDEFDKTFDELNSDYHIYVIEKENKIVATGTLLVEKKFIHQCGKVGHIEDIVVHQHENGKGYGKMIVEYLRDLAKKEGCYKVILDCTAKVENFYQKCDFKSKGIQMAVYFD